MKRLSGHVVIITGAAGGIGSATAARFAEEGARLVLVDRDEAAIRVTRDRVQPGAMVFAADAADEAATAAIVSAAVQHFGRLDCYFANAGMEGIFRPLLEVDIEDFDRLMAVNVRSVLLGIKYAAREMRSGGSIIATSSVAGLIGTPGFGPYVASKHAVLGLVKAAAQELGPRGIRVNAISPGPVENRMMRSIEDQAAPGHGEDVKAAFTRMVPLGRYGRNEEIAAAAAFLASADGAYCNGTTLVCDGGFVAG